MWEGSPDDVSRLPPSSHHPPPRGHWALGKRPSSRQASPGLPARERPHLGEVGFGVKVPPPESLTAPGEAPARHQDWPSPRLRLCRQGRWSCPALRTGRAVQHTYLPREPGPLPACSPCGPPLAQGQSCWRPRGRWRAWRAAEAGGRLGLRAGGPRLWGGGAGAPDGSQSSHIGPGPGRYRRLHLRAEDSGQQGKR